jgi:hypothetical protein
VLNRAAEVDSHQPEVGLERLEDPDEHVLVVDDVDRHHAQVKHALLVRGDGRPEGGLSPSRRRDRAGGQFLLGESQPPQPGAEHAQAEPAALGRNPLVGAQPGEQPRLAVGRGELEVQDVADEQHQQPVVRGRGPRGIIAVGKRQHRQAGVARVIVFSVVLVQRAVEEPAELPALWRSGLGTGRHGDRAPDAVQRRK